MDWIQEFLKPEYIWTLIGLVLILLEFMVPGLIILFFGLGALVVAAAAFFIGISLNTQIILFAVSSVALLVIFRTWLKGVFRGHVTSSQDGNLELRELIGKQVLVTESIVPPRAGTVEINGSNWKANAECVIEAGNYAVVMHRESITLTVKPLLKEG